MSAEPSSPQTLLWKRIAHRWRLLGPPLRATAEDARRLHAAWLGSLPQGAPSRRLEILLLGVTPELALFPWSDDFSLTALDESEAMLHAVWPGDGPGRRALPGDWLHPPFAEASFDLVMTDGGLVTLGSLERMAEMGHVCRRLLRSEGRLVARQFVRPERREEPESLVDAVAEGALRDFNVLKLRLLMSLPAAGDGAATSLPLARETFARLFPDRAVLARRLGCSRETIDTIDAYAGMGDYFFASPAELAAAFEGFEPPARPRGRVSARGVLPGFRIPSARVSMDWHSRLVQDPRLLPPAERAARGGGPLLGALARYRETERLPPAELAGQQRGLLRALAEHAAAESPHFARRLAEASLSPAELAEPGGLARLAPFSRQDLVAAGEDLFCRRVPPGHGEVRATFTSGSTGEPVTVRQTEACALHWRAHTLREHLWHGRDVSARLAVVRAGTAAAAEHPNWGSPCAIVLETGPGLALPPTIPLEELLERIAAFQPGYLLILPSLLAGLLELGQRTGVALPSLRGLRTVSETVSPRLREATQSWLGLEIHDVYSSQEGGLMAMQCPEAGCYHVVESILLEVIDERGGPCRPGETGRVLLTDLVNYATPLVRYEIGDWAEVGPPCPCGRGLPSIARFLGRQRNLVLLPDGTRHWPLFGFHRWGEICAVRQFQFTQLDRHTIAARFCVETPPTPAQTAALVAIIQAGLGYPFEIVCAWQSTPLARGPGGKFEEFLCLAT